MPRIQGTVTRLPLFETFGFRSEDAHTEHFHNIGHCTQKTYADQMRCIRQLPGNESWKVERIGIRLAFDSHDPYRQAIAGISVRVKENRSMITIVELPLWAFLDAGVSKALEDEIPAKIDDDPLRALGILADTRTTPYIGIARSIAVQPFGLGSHYSLMVDFTLRPRAKDALLATEARSDGYAEVALYVMGEKHLRHG